MEAEEEEEKRRKWENRKEGGWEVRGNEKEEIE